MSKELIHTYVPRDVFLSFHERTQRWAVLVAHRRCGKTIAAINDLIAKAVYSQKPNPRYAYLAPYYSQAKAIAWDYLKTFGAPLNGKISEGSLHVTFPHNQSRITLYGADNPDALRGIYLDGVVLDEYAQMRANIFTEIIRPTLADRQGWATFISTPNGPNAFYDVWENAQRYPDQWFSLSLPISVTNLLSPEEIADLRLIMTEEEFAQELECSFFAAMRGSFYGKEMENAVYIPRRDPAEPTHYVFDLGYTDSTALWGWQEQPTTIDVVECYSADNRPISHYIDYLHGRPKPVGQIYLPHDAKAKSLQTGRSIIEQFLSAGIRPKLVPNLDIMDGIQAARLLFPKLRFLDDPSMAEGLKALKVYHRNWDAEKKCYMDRPCHDWSSHYADAFRYFALVAKLKVAAPAPRQDLMSKKIPAMNQFTLDMLYEDRANGRRNGSHPGV